MTYLVLNLFNNAKAVILDSIVTETTFELFYFVSHILCGIVIQTNYHQTCVTITQTAFYSFYNYQEGILNFETFATTLIKRATKNHASHITTFIGIPKKLTSYVKPLIKISPKIVIDYYKGKNATEIILKHSIGYTLEHSIGLNPYPHDKNFKLKILMEEILLYTAYNTITNQTVQKNLETLLTYSESTNTSLTESQDFDIYNHTEQCSIVDL